MQKLSLRGEIFTRGVQNVAVRYFAGYQTCEAVVIPGAGPISVSLEEALGAFSSDQGVAYSSGPALSHTKGTPSSGQYNVEAGLYVFSADDAGKSVLISYGYIPLDIAMAAKEWGAERYAYHARIGQSSKSLGGQETVSFVIKDIPDFVARLLQPYRCVVAP